MKTKPRIRDTVKRLDAALAMVRQDRWQLAGLRSGRLVILAEGPGDGKAIEPPERQVQELTPLARRALYERRAVSISTIHTTPAGGVEDWELDWPTILYAPVNDPGLRPVGLLIIGVREPHWYEDEDLNYITAIAGTLTAFVSAAVDPLRPLTRAERMVAYLLGEGLSGSEIARALRIERSDALQAVGNVLRKLKLRSAGQVADLLEERRTESAPVSLAVKG
jgi:DNA-binding CsgD family transcriptional regulator